MPSKFTEHFNLNQWEATDRIHHDDFNADNRIIDAALAGKLGQPELIYHYDTTGQNYAANITIPPSILDSWDDWAYVCFLVHYTDMDTSSARLKFWVRSEDGKEKVISPLSLPGYMVVFLPMRDSSQTAGGLVLADRFYSFSACFSYRKMSFISIGVESGSPICPSIYVFGGR